jgi:glutamate 5-kinase
LQRIVLKVGSAVLTQDGELAIQRLQNLVEFIVELKTKYDVILVSSGAVAAGYTLLKLDKNILENKQALASLGQPLLMNSYKNYFMKYDIISSQLLLEASTFRDEKRLSHAKKTIDVLLRNNVIPIINENDVTAVEELVFGDNDQLAAYVTENFDSQMLVILTDIDGYYDKNPHIYNDSILQKVVNKITDDMINVQDNPNTTFATGGIATKLKAAKFLLENDKTMYLSSGFDLSFAKDFLLNAMHIKGTIFKNA